jgi:hypothetical protein
MSRTILLVFVPLLAVALMARFAPYSVLSKCMQGGFSSWN